MKRDQIGSDHSTDHDQIPSSRGPFGRGENKESERVAAGLGVVVVVALVPSLGSFSLHSPRSRRRRPFGHPSSFCSFTSSLSLIYSRTTSYHSTPLHLHLDSRSTKRRYLFTPQTPQLELDLDERGCAVFLAHQTHLFLSLVIINPRGLNPKPNASCPSTLHSCIAHRHRRPRHPSSSSSTTTTWIEL